MNQDFKKFEYQRVNVVGSSGSGKSYFSKLLAEKLQIPHIEMDQLFWKPNWTEPTDEEFFPKLETALNVPTWVLDGNYARTTSIKWKNVTHVIWLDYSFGLTIYQSVSRSIKRAISQQELWPGTNNKESFQRSFLSRKSIILWSIQNYINVRIKYEKIMNDPKYSHIQFIRLKSPQEANMLLRSLK